MSFLEAGDGHRFLEKSQRVDLCLISFFLFPIGSQIIEVSLWGCQGG
jgi:hypothetical protein